MLHELHTAQQPMSRQHSSQASTSAHKVTSQQKHGSMEKTATDLIHT
jgi:hypothetical protein